MHLITLPHQMALQLPFNGFEQIELHPLCLLTSYAMLFSGLTIQRAGSSLAPVAQILTSMCCSWEEAQQCALHLALIFLERTHLSQSEVPSRVQGSEKPVITIDRLEASGI